MSTPPADAADLLDAFVAAQAASERYRRSPFVLDLDYVIPFDEIFPGGTRGLSELPEGPDDPQPLFVEDA